MMIKEKGMEQQKFETLAIHAGRKVDTDTMSIGLPVARTSAYQFKSAEHASNLFELKEAGNIYSRLGNPTNDFLEKRITALEGGAASVAVSSGTNAVFYTVITIAKEGDEVVSANNLYGGTYTMFDAILPNFGIKTAFVDPKEPANFEKAINDKTRLIYIETIGNPALDFTDIEEVSKIAKKHNLPLVVDATFTTPYLLRTIEHGADIVINSLTKWIGGHGTGIGGIVTDSGKFNWKDKKFSLFTEPDPNYHGLKWAYELPEEYAAIPFAMRLRLVPLRNLGGCISPDNSWMFLQGAETLSLRMERHSENAMKAAEYLSANPKAAWVRYPGLKNDPSYKTASKYLKKGFGGMVVFGVKGDKDAGKIFIENLELFSHCANVGDAKSIATHPASTTHSQLSAKDQLAGGITPDLVRLSIGIENIDDIIADLKNSLGKI